MKLLEADLKTGNIVNYNQNPLDIYCLKNTACSVDKFARIMPKKHWIMPINVLMEQLQ